jgi:ParB-like chromosome segregation protein Spo0J
VEAVVLPIDTIKMDFTTALREYPIDPKSKKRYDPNPNELMLSIEESGLINPLIVDDQNQLLSGFRRLLACRRLGYTDVPVLRRVKNEHAQRPPCVQDS